MKIECVPSEGRKAFITIFCDEDPWREVHTAIFGKKFTLPQCQSKEELSQKFQALEYRFAKLYVIRRLSAQNLPSSVLSKSLKERLVSEVTTLKLIEEFQELGYLNDGLWIDSFVRVQSQQKRGPKAIAQKLAMKGIAKDQIATALRTSCSISQQKESLKKLLETRYRQRDLSNFREKQKVIASLIRRGFELSLIIEVINETSIEE